MCWIPTSLLILGPGHILHKSFAAILAHFFLRLTSFAPRVLNATSSLYDVAYLQDMACLQVTSASKVALRRIDNAWHVHMWDNLHVGVHQPSCVVTILALRHVWHRDVIHGSLVLCYPCGHTGCARLRPIANIILCTPPWPWQGSPFHKQDLPRNTRTYLYANP